MSPIVTYVDPTELRLFFEESFKAIKCPPDDSRLIIEGLLETSLRGVDSHGVRLMPHYILGALSGRINVAPHLRFRRTSAATMQVDGDHGYGIVVGTKAMESSISLARESGMGAVAVANSSHFGAAALYSLIAARHDMIGLCFTHTDALVVPYGGRNRFLGTNPICFAAPSEGEEPFCLDMSTSVTSWNRIQDRKARGEKLEDGWAADQDGEQCSDPERVISLFPIGSYKGYGLGLMVEILCSLLTGMPYGPHLPRMFPVNGQKRMLGHFFIAMDIARFVEVQVFKRRLRELLDELRSQPPAKGFHRVWVAGDPEKEQYQERRVKGIPITEVDRANFRSIARILNVDQTRYPVLFP